MSELTRTLASRLRHFLGDRRRAERFKVSLPVRVTRLAEPHSSSQPESIEGQTVDLSSSGIAVILPAIRIAGHYLAGEDRKLELRLHLPTREVSIETKPVRYERLEDEETTLGYLIGMTITGMSEADREVYQSYLATLVHR
jgi:PilZ domain-containing protein